ncbi:relaxase/mobilization nuclease domain-containing protein [Kitasatospora sp. NPDC056783]|uniref:relaxase/mobilization nuclease domain-containing protein n=1 Tax=Kitasatospora sp. NPDC056783 TaxID=3345943 RepID=UPI003684F2AB
MEDALIPNITRGDRTYRLLSYLYGPGRKDEHADPHLVASWDGFAPDPGRDPNATIKQLQKVLDLRVDQRGPRRRLKKPVWHCSVRTAPGDRLLSDEEWAVVARRVVAAAGIAEEGDPDGCRWVAVRHADDHIHIAATIVRGDLRKADIEFDFRRVQAECRKIEREWGLRELNPGDGTAAKEPTNREKHKAQRLGEADTSRQQLRDAVRQALAGARDEAEFFARLETTGVLVNRKVGPSGDTLGYSVAVVGEHDHIGEPVWFGGYKLAPDLTLPKIRRRLATPASEQLETVRPTAQDSGARIPSGRRAPAAAARLRVADTALEAIDLLDGEPEAAAGVVEATGEVLDALAATALPAQKAELLAAARAYERASRSHVRAANADSRSVRAAAREVLSGGYTTNRGPDATAAAGALAALILLVIAAGRWHAKQGHLQQAAAARAAADNLRAAYRQAARQPLAALRERGRQLPTAVRERHEQAVRRAVPGEGGRRMLAEPQFDALAAALAEAEAAGHDPDTLLERARSWRELDTAGSVTAVLTWRVRHLAKLPHPAAGKPHRSASALTPPTPATPAAPSRQRR